MATTSIELPVCSICNDYLLDPRALPCGHSFCGPPRTCLSALKIPRGRLKCAVCRIDHNVQVGRMKPLYGIRDFFQGVQEASCQESKKDWRLPCSVHKENDCTFWCSHCSVMICDDCLEEYHDDHAIRRLKKYLMEKIESQLGKPFHESWSKYGKDLETSVASLVRKSEKLKNQISNMERELPIMSQHKKWLEQYHDVSKTNKSASQLKEVFILTKVSESGLLDLKHFTDETANSKSVQTENVFLSKASVKTESPSSDDNNSSCQPSSSKYRKTTLGEKSSTSIDADHCAIVSSQETALALRDSITKACPCGNKRNLNDIIRSPIRLTFRLSVDMTLSCFVYFDRRVDVSFSPLIFTLEAEMSKSLVSVIFYV